MVGKNEIGFSYMRNAEIRFFFLDHIDQIHDGHDILTGFHVIQAGNRKNTETVQDFCVAAGKLCDVLKINMRMLYLNICIKL